MSDKHDETKKFDVPKPRTITDFAAEFLAEDAVAIIIRQHLLPDDIENPVIFPPTYLKAKDKAPYDDGDEKDEKQKTRRDAQKSVYNLDGPPNGDNVCEIDSPQSDGNRSEPLFKSDALKHLVPQVVISVNGTPVNLLDAGHRAADAVVRFSSLALEFHTGFTRADAGDHSVLATLAPTSLLYGVWDSRSTQTKLQRIIKAGVRAQNVRPLTKSATFIPAAEYVKVGAIKEELDVGKSDNNPLSAEGMKYALASQTLGGVRLTDPKLLVRTIKINLTALRQLQAIIDPPKLADSATDDQKRTFEDAKKEALDLSMSRATSLRNYILGLALVAATSDPDLNLREGCNLRVTGSDRIVLVKHRKDDESVTVDRKHALEFAKTSGKEFFGVMGIEYDKKDHLEATFEKDVAEEFLGLTDAERDKVRRLGPTTRATLAKYWEGKKSRDREGDPVEVIRKLVNDLEPIKGDKFSKANGKPLTKLLNFVKTIMDDLDADHDLKNLATKIEPLLNTDPGAAARKIQMLELFPAAVVDQSAEAPAEATEAAAQ